MIRRPPRSTLDRSSAASDVYKRQTLPQIAQLRHHKDIENILDQVRKTPDFVLVPKGKDEVYLVEVKYRHEYNNSELTTLAREIHDQWEYSWLFLASLLLSMAASQVSAGFVIGNEAVTLPDVPGLGIDFRCEDGDGGPENCPMDGNNEIGFSDDDGSKYLQFQATDDESCQFLTLTEEVDGIGIGCDDLASTDDALINQGQRLVIYVNDGEGGVSTPMDGIYLAGILNNYDDEDDECYAQSGTVEITVGFGDGSSTTIIPWASDIDLDSACEDTLHAIFVDFGGTQDVTEVSVSVDNAQPGNGVYAAGIAVGMAQGPNVNPNLSLIHISEPTRPY